MGFEAPRPPSLPQQMKRVSGPVACAVFIKVYEGPSPPSTCIWGKFEFRNALEQTFYKSQLSKGQVCCNLLSETKNVPHNPKGAPLAYHH